MENKILKIISKYYPYPLIEIKNVYDKVKSFDKTIRILDFACRSYLSPSHAIEKIDFIIKVMTKKDYKKKIADYEDQLNKVKYKLNIASEEYNKLSKESKKLDAEVINLKYEMYFLKLWYKRIFKKI